MKGCVSNTVLLHLDFYVKYTVQQDPELIQPFLIPALSTLAEIIAWDWFDNFDATDPPSDIKDRVSSCCQLNTHLQVEFQSVNVHAPFITYVIAIRLFP